MRVDVRYATSEEMRTEAQYEKKDGDMGLYWYYMYKALIKDLQQICDEEKKRCKDARKECQKLLDNGGTWNCLTTQNALLAELEGVFDGIKKLVKK